MHDFTGTTRLSLEINPISSHIWRCQHRIEIALKTNILFTGERKNRIVLILSCISSCTRLQSKQQDKYVGAQLVHLLVPSFDGCMKVKKIKLYITVNAASCTTNADSYQRVARRCVCCVCARWEYSIAYSLPAIVCVYARACVCVCVM